MGFHLCDDITRRFEARFIEGPSSINYCTVSENDANLRFSHIGISLSESETIYNILNKTFRVVEDDQESQFSEEGLQGTIKIDFPLPFCEPFFQLFAEGWFSMKQVLKDMRKRRGKTGLELQIYFAGFIQDNEIFHTKILFQMADLSPKEFEMAIEKIDYIVDIILAELVKIQNTHTTVIYFYDILRRKWVRRNRV